jgi:uncharacterized protein (TIGR00369 family)
MAQQRKRQRNMSDTEARAIPLDALRDMAGLEVMRGMAAGRLPRPPIGTLMNMHTMEVEPGIVTFEALPEFKHYNPIGSVHGGFAATLLDSCMGCAIHSSLAAGIGYTTVDLAIKYIKAMTDKTGPVFARGEVITSGKRVATAQGWLRDASGALIATGTTTCLVFPIGSAAKA